MSRLARQLLTLFGATLLACAHVALAQDIKLPDMGSPADAVLSKNEESRIGSAIMRQINASGMVLADPQINEYINELLGHFLTFIVIFHEL